MFNFDLRFTNAVQLFRSSITDKVMLFVSMPGYGIDKYSLLFIVFILLLYKKLIREGVVLLFSSLGAELLGIAVKSLVARQRPDAMLIDYIYHAEKTFSFPSGHVVYYMGFFGFIFYISIQRIENDYLRKANCGICLFFVLLVGLSRIYLGAHWFSDVVGGYILGGIWLIISIKLYNTWLSHYEAKN